MSKDKKKKAPKGKPVYKNEEREGTVEVECIASRGSFSEGFRYYVTKEVLERYEGNLKEVK